MGSNEDEILQWVNATLATVGVPAIELTTGFQTGVNLGKLLSALTGRKIRTQRKAKQKLICLDNIRVCIEFTEHLGLDRIGKRKVEPAAFYDGDLKLLLPFLLNLRAAFPAAPASPTAAAPAEAAPAEASPPAAAPSRESLSHPGDLQASILSMVATALGDGSAEEASFFKLTKKFNKGKVGAEEFVLEVRAALGEPVASEVLPLMAEMLSGKPEIQESLVSVLHSQQKRETMVLPSVMEPVAATEEVTCCHIQPQAATPSHITHCSTHPTTCCSTHYHSLHCSLHHLLHHSLHYSPGWVR